MLMGVPALARRGTGPVARRRAAAANPRPVRTATHWGPRSRLLPPAVAEGGGARTLGGAAEHTQATPRPNDAVEDEVSGNSAKHASYQIRGAPPRMRRRWRIEQGTAPHTLGVRCRAGAKLMYANVEGLGAVAETTAADLPPYWKRLLTRPLD